MHKPRHTLHKPPLRSGTSAPSSSSNHIAFTNLAPQTPGEHYWASRAQRAEALLSVREKHYEEIGKIREEETLKRTRELETLENQYKRKHDKLEKLVFIFVGIVAFLLVALIYLIPMRRHSTQSLGLGYALGSFIRHRPNGHPGSWLNLHFHLPARFTIPILSPWSSIVEHQVSNSTSNTTTSWSVYLIIISLLVAISSIFIWLGVFRNLASEKIIHQRRPSTRSGSGVWQLIDLLRDVMPVFSVLPWTWSWLYRFLHLLGFPPQ